MCFLDAETQRRLAVRFRGRRARPSLGIDLRSVGAGRPRRFRGLDRVRLPADPMILAGFARALAKARAVALAA